MRVLVTGGTGFVGSWTAKAVEDAQGVVDAIGAKKPGDTVVLEIYRGDSKRSLRVKLGERPAQLASQQSQEEPFQLP